MTVEASSRVRPASGRGSTSARPGRAGFLLVEALATLAISAVILAALGSLLGLMSRQADTLADRTQERDVSGRALAAIVRDLGSAVRARWSGPGPRAFVFAGQSDRMLLAVDRIDAAQRTETVAVLLQSTVTETGTVLLRSEAPLSPRDAGSGNLDFAHPRTLYTGPAGIRFAYVMAASANGPEVLLDAWTAGDAVPVAVRVAFTDVATDEIRSSLRVPLRVEAEPGCGAPRKAFCSRVDARALEASRGENGPAASGVEAPPRRVP